MSNIYVTSGDDYEGIRRLTMTATDSDGNALDLTGAGITFEVRRRRSLDPLFTKTEADGIEIATQSGDTLGVAYIALDAADTDDLDGRYYWELQGDDAVGVATLGSGVFYVTGDMIEP